MSNRQTGQNRLQGGEFRAPGSTGTGAFGRKTAVGLCAVLLTLMILLLASTASAMDQRFSGFINDSRWTNGVAWASNQAPKISGISAKGSKAYCADFTCYCYGVSDPTSGVRFTNAQEVMAGDVLYFGNPTLGTDQWFVVLERYTDNTLYVAEIYGGSVFINTGKYAISNNLINSRSIVGYHCQNTSPDVRKAALDVYIYVDGKEPAEGTSVGSFSVTVGGETYHRLADYYTLAVVGTYYSDSNIVADSGFIFNGVTQGKQSGTIPKEGMAVRLSFSAGYTVQYDANGGSGAPQTQTKQKGVNLTLSRTIPVRTGYTFLGWAISRTATTATYQPGDIYKLNMSTTLYAVWEMNIRTYTVSFDSQGGTAVTPQTVEYGKKAKAPQNPTRDGYTFDKWSYYSVEDKEWKTFDFSIAITRDVTLYAQWTKNVQTYTVQFNSNGGTAVATQTVKSGSKAVKPQNPTRDGYVFDKWVYFDEEMIQHPFDFDTLITKNVALYALWSKNVRTYTVTFNSNGGTAVDSQTVKSGETAVKPLNPTKTGYIFDKWVYYDEVMTQHPFDFNTRITQNYTLYALWIQNVRTYTVTFNSNGGTAVDSQTIRDGGKASKPRNPTKAGYTFDMWVYVDEEMVQKPFDFDTEITRDYILYARWTESIQYYTIDFDSWGGTEVDSQTVESGEKAVKPDNPTKAGYLFDQWMYYVSVEGEWQLVPFDFDTVITMDYSLIAHWLTRTFTVRFNSDGGSEVASQTVNYGEKAFVPANPVRPGYVFKGWMLDGQAFDFNTLIYSDVTLSADWEETPEPAERVVVDGNVYLLNLSKKTASFDGPEKDSSVTEIVIPASIKANKNTTYKVTTIEPYACESLKTLTSVTIGKNVKTIGKGAFSGCKKLATVSGGAGVTTIGDAAFKNCSVLTAVTLNSNVKTIGKNAFYGCKKLKKITIKTTKLKTVGDNAFKNIYKKAVITCPKKKLKEYKKLLLTKGVPKTATFQ